MGGNAADKISLGNEAEGSQTNIEIKVKTLDSQTYTLRVNKQVPVPDLKEQIASVTGVLSEQQRLICRGKVLKDDQLLSAYHVEDGHTLHMVSRQPIPSPSEGFHNLTANDPASSTSHSQRIQVAPGVLVETFNIPDQGEGVHPDINRIVAAVLGSFGINNSGTGSSLEALLARNSERHEGALGAGGMTGSIQVQQEQVTTVQERLHSSFGLPTGVALGNLQPRVIPDSLTTLSQYLSRMRQEYGDNVAVTHRTEGRDSSSQPGSGTVQEGLPTPTFLAEVLMSTREMLIAQTADCLLQLGRQLNNQANVTDPMIRSSTQSEAWRSGILLQNLGAFLLELGRTTMTLRMGQTPSEAVVNAGPAVFISQSGPNPLMVQPVPFQPGTNFGMIPPGTGQSGSGLVNDIVPGFVPRHIEIHIRRGPSTARPDVNQEEPDGSRRTPGQANPVMGTGNETYINQQTTEISDGSSVTAEPGVRLMPVRTMVAVPGALGRLPFLGRIQHVASGRSNNQRGSQLFAEYQQSSFQTETQQNSESGAQQNIDNHASGSNSANPAVEQGSLPAATTSRSFSVNILSTSGSRSNLESEREIPSDILQLLRSLFPSSEFQLQGSGLQPMAPAPAPPPVTQNAGTSTNAAAAAAMETQEAEPRISEEGIFISNLLRQVMPYISQSAGVEPNAESANEHNNGSDHRTTAAEAGNSDAGTSRRQSDDQLNPPNSKRQKME